MGLGEEREIRAQKAINLLMKREEFVCWYKAIITRRSKIKQKQLFYMLPNPDPCIFTYFSIISFQ